jgi:hypothetical protein
MRRNTLQWQDRTLRKFYRKIHVSDNSSKAERGKYFY